MVELSDGRRPEPRRLAAAVITLLEGELAREGVELLDVRVFRGGGRLQLRIYLDLPAGGITLDRCAAASRSIGMLLEEADLIPERYVIEVSSPGIRRPLRTPAHFEAARDQRVDLRVRQGRHVRGLLVESGPTGYVVEPLEGEGEPVRVAVEDLVEANLDPEFDARAIIGADRRAKKDARRKGRGKSRTGKRRRDESDG